MLSEYIKIDELYKRQARYITNSAKAAARTYKMLRIRYEVFEGTLIDLTPKMCENIYKELLSMMIERNQLIGNRYGLLATIIPMRDKDSETVIITLQLGVTFPDFIDPKKSHKPT